jgi:ubiquinone/menaquinone biosynthesis C-methylase UbiE
MEDKSLEKKIAKRFDNLEHWFPDTYNRHDFRIRYILKSIDNIKNAKILDVGCGKGGMVRILSKLGAQVHGIDISKELLKEAKKIPLATIKIGSATDIPYPDDTFDYVISNEVIEHVPSTEKAIKEMSRVVKKGGKIILIDKNRWSLHHRLVLELMYIKNYKKDLRMYPKGFKFRQKWFSRNRVNKIMSKHCREVASKNLNFPFIGLFIGWTAKK